MGALIKSELRKIFTTNVWWALLIPAALVTLLVTLGGSAFGMLISSVASQAQDTEINVPLALLVFPAAVNFGTIFTTIFGGLAVAAEFQHRTITTTYLTAPSRTSVLLAKLAAYAGFGLLYGVVIALFGSIGALLTLDIDNFPNLGSWLLLCLVAVLSNVLWAVLGVGLGALMSNQIAIVLVVPLGALVERLLRGLLGAQGVGEVGNFLPNAVGNGLVSGVGQDLFLDNIPTSMRTMGRALTDVSEPAWWVSGLVFLGYIALFLGLGRLVAQRRDIA
ncbi:ABC transporter permease [Crossiella cryophila]|uniref:ABC-2 type transport system permease protein n=1 Tax=Crossiella cryophila TaxID=43355 RepID=A0A7W7C9P6_9PSEU|nr:ABC transporter permease subunit [Crossiella cryophila]MBB4675916.1 ABC-2 type transport system permease protein [Crossiella cryophila]